MIFYSNSKKYSHGQKVVFKAKNLSESKVVTILRRSGFRYRVLWFENGERQAAWADEEDLSQFPTAPPKCECGSAVISSDYPHSYWCPRYLD